MATLDTTSLLAYTDGFSATSTESPEQLLTNDYFSLDFWGVQLLWVVCLMWGVFEWFGWSLKKTQPTKLISQVKKQTKKKVWLFFKIKVFTMLELNSGEIAQI